METTSTSSGRHTRKRKAADAKDSGARADRKRVQNRISQQCAREKQLARTRQREAFISIAKSSSEKEGDGESRYQTLLNSHMRLIEENEKLKDALLRMRKKLLSLSNTAATTADDEIFDDILRTDRSPRSEKPSRSRSRSTTNRPEALQEVQPGGQPLLTSEELDAFPRSAANEPESTPELSVDKVGDQTTRDVEHPRQNGSDLELAGHETQGGGMFNVCLDDPTPSFELMDPALFNFQPPFFSRGLGPLGTSTFPLDGSRSSNQKTMTSLSAIFVDKVGEACVTYLSQALGSMGQENEISWPDTDQCHIQSLQEPTGLQMVSDLATVAVYLLATFAGLESFVFGVGGGPVLERVMRWRINPTVANRLAIPEPLRPTPLQYRNLKHPLSIDFVNWPTIRDQLILLSNPSDIDKITRDIVLNTVIEFPHHKSAVSIFDIFYSGIMSSEPSSTCLKIGAGTGDTFWHSSHQSNSGLVLDPLLLEISSRMQATADGGIVQKKSVMSRDHVIGSWDNAWSSASASSAEVPKVPKSGPAVQYGVDRLSQWKLSREFAQKYPFLDCTDVVASYDMVPCTTLPDLSSQEPTWTRTEHITESFLLAGTAY